MTDRSQSTGSFIGDLKKAIQAGGASKMTKKYDVKKGDTLSGIAKAHNTTIKMLQKLNPKISTDYGYKGTDTAEGQKMMQFNFETLRVPDPQTFTGFKLRAVKSKKKKDPYKGQTKSEMKEMNRKIMSDKDLKKQQEKVAKTKDRAKKMGGTMVKKRDGGVENVKKEIRSAVNMGNLMLSDLKKQGIIPKGAKVKGSEALKPGAAEKRVEGFIKSQKKKGKSKEEAIKKMLKQTKQLKKGLDVGYTKARKTAGLLPERNIPTVKKAMGGVMKNRGGTFKGTF
tara:strand:+ start:104 stop:949 length:846 start_codon:yes stop_codon:yes gene_type:complete